MATGTVTVLTSTSARGWSAAWRGRDVQAATIILAASARCLRGQCISGTVEIEFTSDAAIRRFNKQFRGKDKPTNVLSFPNPSQPFGAIVLALETIRAEAKAQSKPFLFHVKHMILHGFLHLIGHDHEIATERRLMERLEIRILADMGIPNPYLLAK